MLADDAEPESVLAGLDPEQQEAARGRPRAGLHPGRRRHRQDPRDHPPDRVRGAHRRGPAAAAAGGDVHHAGGRRAARAGCGRSGAAGRPGAHVPRRRAAPAALLLAAGARRRAAPAGRQQAPPGRRGGAPGRRLRADRTELRDLAAEIEWAKVSLRPARGYAARGGQAAGSRRCRRRDVAAVYDAYEELKRAPALLDFEDLLLLTAAAIEEHRDVARQLRAHYRHFVVDEYQDVNPLQQRLLDAWLGGRDDLCVVGDPNQTIYSFTGATPALPARLPARATPARRWSGWCATTGRPRRWSTWPTGVLGRGRAAAPARPGRPAAGRSGADLRRVRRRAGRGRRPWPGGPQR